MADDSPDPEQLQKAAPGWYPDPKMANTQRYWDGERWTDNAAPASPAQHVVVREGVSTWKGIRIVAFGILAALATVFVIYNLSQPSDLDCATQRAEVALGERNVYEVDDACR